MTTFDGIFNTRCYVTSEVLSPLVRDQNTGELVSSNVPTGFLFVANDATSVMEFLQHTFQLFFITAIAVLLITLIICSFTVQKMVDPLKSMCSFAHRFARGEVDVRITDYKNRNDEIGELAAAFNAMADSLAQAEQKRSEFVANVSHELRTPLTAITGWAETIQSGELKDPGDVRKGMDIIVSEAHRLTNMVEELLEFSRIEDGRFTLSVEPMDIKAELEDAVYTYREFFRREGIELNHFDCDEEFPPIAGDPERLRQVFCNLLDNAAKFAAKGTTITVQITKKDGKAYTSIRNLGATIPPDELSLLFDRFHKADKARSADREGWGLGLYIAKTIIGAHGGEIWATSENGVTEFTFTLPAVR